MDKMLSFVIPVYNEEESLKLLHDGIISNIPADFSYEIIFVNDGSTDRSAEIIKSIISEDSNVHLISFRKNFGKAMALETGFKNVKGDIIFTMDADLQDDPIEIPRFIEKLDEGFDVVSGWKENRQDPLEKRLPSKLFNKVTSQMSGIKLHDFNCGFKAYRRVVTDSIDIYGELHRYIPVVAYRKGFKTGEISVHHNKRRFGKSKYGIERYLRGLFDSLTVAFLGKYYDRPMHLFGKAGLLCGFAGFVICVYLVVLKCMGQAIGGRPLLTLGVLLIVLGVQMFSTGFIGDMIVATHYRHHYDEAHVLEKI